MVNNKEQGTYEDTLNKSEATVLEEKKPFYYRYRCYRSGCSWLYPLQKLHFCST